LEKYHLANLPPATQPQVQNTATPQRTNTDVTDAMIKGAFMRAFPVMIITVVLMALLSGVLVRAASRSYSAVPPSAAAPAGMPALPEDLRVVKLPLMEYSVEAISAIALEKEITMDTHAYTSTTAGQVYSVGNQIHSTPGQTTTSISTTQKDLIWVRTTDGRETSWTFTGGDFKVRPGHVISAITLAGGSGKQEFVLSYNHNTGQLIEFKGVPYGTRGSKAWWVSTFIGSIGFGIAVAMILSIQPEPVRDPVDLLIRPLADWVMGGIAAGILSFFVVGRATAKINGKRQAAYRQKYPAGFRQFLQQSTPALQKFFGVVPAAPVTRA
jgi:hypothetical protein